MGADTWNFPCYQTMDEGTGATRGSRGMAWAIGPDAGTTQPFTETFTCIFSYLYRTGFSHTNATDFPGQGIFSIGVKSSTRPGVAIDLRELTNRR
ncbi:MAG: hypothetical protein KAJ19_09040, partial [Gammaproteobacteria bacterium]|nr:hypothetical protein [Gammaproteobacteria bacterium]